MSSITFLTLADLPSPMPDLEIYLSSPVKTFVVGKEGGPQTSWILHRDVLAHRVEYWEVALTRGWLETFEGKIVLDAEDYSPAIFEEFVTWVYTGELSKKDGPIEENFMFYFEVYQLAHMWMMEDLRLGIVDMLVEKCRNIPDMTPGRYVDYIALRMDMVDATAVGEAFLDDLRRSLARRVPNPTTLTPTPVASQQTTTPELDLNRLKSPFTAAEDVTMAGIFHQIDRNNRKVIDLERLRAFTGLPTIGAVKARIVRLSAKLREALTEHPI